MSTPSLPTGVTGSIGWELVEAASAENGCVEKWRLAYTIVDSSISDNYAPLTLHDCFLAPAPFEYFTKGITSSAGVGYDPVSDDPFVLGAASITVLPYTQTRTGYVTRSGAPIELWFWRQEPDMSQAAWQAGIATPATPYIYHFSLPSGTNLIATLRVGWNDFTTTPAVSRYYDVTDEMSLAEVACSPGGGGEEGGSGCSCAWEPRASGSCAWGAAQSPAGAWSEAGQPSGSWSSRDC